MLMTVQLLPPPLPGCPADGGGDDSVHDPVHASCQLVQRGPPAPERRQVGPRAGSQRVGAEAREVLVRDRVAPGVELVELATPRGKRGSERVYGRPEARCESPEVVPYRSSVRVLPVETTTEGEGDAQRVSVGRLGGGNHR